MEKEELNYFSYNDWEVGDDDKIRVGDKIYCNHQRPHDGYEQDFKGRVVLHIKNKMPAILVNNNDYISIQSLWLEGWTFTRLKE